MCRVIYKPNSGYLALGATAQQASQQPVRQALRAALMPTVNGLMVIGIVTLPGMMTGQILAGASPLIAIRYQIVVAFMHKLPPSR